MFIVNPRRCLSKHNNCPDYSLHFRNRNLWIGWCWPIEKFKSLRSLAPEIGCVMIILTLLTYIIYNTITSSSPLTIIGWREWDSIRVPAEVESSNGRAGTRTNSAGCGGRVARPRQTGERWRPGGGDTRGFVISFWKHEDFLNRFVYTFYWSRAFFDLKTILSVFARPGATSELSLELER